MAKFSVTKKTLKDVKNSSKTILPRKIRIHTWLFNATIHYGNNLQLNRYDRFSSSRRINNAKLVR